VEIHGTVRKLSVNSCIITTKPPKAVCTKIQYLRDYMFFLCCLADKIPLITQRSLVQIQPPQPKNQQLTRLAGNGEGTIREQGAHLVPFSLFTASLRITISTI